MKNILSTFFIVLVVSMPIAGEVLAGEVQNLSVDQRVTAKIQAFDKKFFKDFVVYSAGTLEAPTALLFDRKDKFTLPVPLWEKPLTGEQEIILAINRLRQQSEDRSWNIPMPLRALNIVNTKGQVLGYIYTGLETDGILMKREKDGRVAVYLPSPRRYEGGGGGGGGGK